MKNHVLFAATAIALCSTNVIADAIGVTVGTQAWQSHFSGSFGKLANQQNFNLDNKTQGSYFVAFEHPLPFLPNLRVSKTTLDTQGSALLATNFEFDNTTFSGNTNVSSIYKQNFVDYTFYYEVFDNDLLSFDFGLTARHLKSNITVSGMVNNVLVSAQQTDSRYIPMLYVATEIGIPGTNLFVFGNGNLLSIDRNSLYDYQAGMRYQIVDNLAVNVSATVGYRALNLKLVNVNSLYTDLSFHGVFAGLQVHF